MDLKQFKKNAKQAIKGNISDFFIVGVIMFLISGVLNMPSFSNSAGYVNSGVDIAYSMTQNVGPFITIAGLIGFIVSSMFELSIAKMFLTFANEGQVPVAKDVFYGWKNLLQAVFLNLINTIFIFLWSLLFIIPGIIKYISYSMSFYILQEEDGIEANAARKKSMEIMEGHKGEYFMLCLSFIGWWILSFITFGLALIYVWPYWQTAKVNFYNAIKNGQN